MKDNTTPVSNCNTLQAQRQRLLHYLQSHRSITTIEAREILDIMHPSGRIMELKNNDGHNIITNWRIDHTADNKPHRVAEYVLLNKVGAAHV